MKHYSSANNHLEFVGLKDPSAMGPAGSAAASGAEVEVRGRNLGLAEAGAAAAKAN